MTPSLSALIALQALDSAADAARKRLAELPAAEQAIAASVAAAESTLDAVEARLQENHHARRALEKDVAAVDTRLARFEDHKAAVKTNHEYTALLHEMATARAEKDGIEEKILVLMEAADGLTAEQKAAEAALGSARKDGDRARAAFTEERTTIARELERLAHERSREVREIEAPVLNKYEQLLKQRRGIAIARMAGELCTACHVRLRPHIAQQVRRNDSIVQCDSCQRMLYFVAPAESATT